MLADDDDDSMNLEDSVVSISASQVPSSEPMPESERAFGRYVLLRRLAYGGMGEIFLARQGGVGSLAPVAKLVVIKRILSHMKRDEKHRRMFLDEARLQALLTNPHIVAIHDMGEENGHVYLAMEHVHGPSWRALVDRCRRTGEEIPLAHVATMVAQAARGLAYAHNLVDATGAPLKIVHRDINPHNLLVNYEGDVKLIDFGIAKSELADGQTETGTIKGKFTYMSPEQSAALPLDHRSDVFALGICLYELLTLTNPFRKSNAVLSLESIQRDTPPPLERRRRDAEVFQPIIDKCLAKHREARFDDCGEIVRALDALVTLNLVTPANKPLSTWLRELFADEIAFHVLILEQTGSQGALAMLREGSNPVARRPTTGDAPAAAPVALEDRESVFRDLSSDVIVTAEAIRRVDQGTSATPIPRQSAPPLASDPVTIVENDALDVRSIAETLEPRRRSRWRLFALAGVASAIGAGELVTSGTVDRFLLPLDPASLTPSDESARVAVRGELVVPVATPPPPQPPPPAPSPADEAPAPVAAALEEVAVEGPPREVLAAGKRPVAKKVVATGPRKLKVLAGTLLVTSEGYQVKGNRKLVIGESTTLIVDDASAPYSLKVRVRAAADGSIGFDVDTDPWSIVRIDGVSKGRSPQRNIPLPAGKRLDLELTNPKAPTMRLTLLLGSQ
jgi:serine/threonine-protein kinase